MQQHPENSILLFRIAEADNLAKCAVRANIHHEWSTDLREKTWSLARRGNAATCGGALHKGVWPIAHTMRSSVSKTCSEQQTATDSRA